ncbi:hypothetical protein [uncultured Tateyamaria sp.]|uniref:hypothetical protein n=1 Tax=uncultured Tateyamaria sp. TaxID=455651 RepID=UPI00261AFB66|nr:hypothetical protein [uncultured Tateyamaria sp.]
MFQDALANSAVLQRAGLAAAVLSVYAFWPYIRDILAGRTRPERSSWLIWALLSAVSLLSQTYEGAQASLGFAAMQTAGTVLICGLTFWRGERRGFDTEDSQVLTATAIGIWLWAEMETAAYAMMVTISMSAMGGVLTMKKAYADPGSETMATWAAFFVASALAAVSVGQLDWLLLAYPLYVMALSAAIMLAMVLGRKRAPQVERMDSAMRRTLTMSIRSLDRAPAGSTSGTAQKGA